MTQATKYAAVESRQDLESIGTSLQVLHRAFNQTRSHEKILADAGVRLDRAGATLLHQLHVCNNDVRISDLAELLSIDAPAVTRKVQQLEQLGYLTVTPDTDDKRAKRIHLTKSGETTIERIRAAKQRRLAKLFDGWSDNDLTTFNSSLARFAGALSKELENHRD